MTRTEGDRLGQRRLEALQLTEKARSSQFFVRQAYAVLGAGFLSFQYPLLCTAVYLVTILTSQFLDNSLKQRILYKDRAEVLKRSEYALLYASNVQSAMCFGVIPFFAWFSPDPGFRIFAICWLAGSMLHVMLHMHHDRTTFLSSMIPHALLALALPLSEYLLFDDVDLALTSAVLFAITAFIAHFVTAYRTYHKNSSALRDAQHKAEDQRRVAERASKAKSDFLATLSHEIRTPMNGIIGMTAALQQTDLPSEAKKHLQVVRESSDLLLSLVNDVLDMSKIEAGRITLEKRVLDIRASAERVVALHRQAAEKKGLVIAVDIDERIPDRLTGDPHRVVQILHNLVSNAIKFTQEGGITVALQRSQDRPYTVQIEVRDTGIGMTAEQAARVFEPFAQADSSTTRRFGGTGLGLTITRGFIEAMGGHLVVETSEGEGSCFCFSLHFEPADNLPDTVIAAADGVPSLKGRRVLAIDDNRVNLSVLEQLLAKEGADLFTAESGEEGLALFDAGVFELVLLDISMPNLDGPEVLERMRAMAPDGGMPPVVAVSAHALPEEVAYYSSLGFDAYVTKPVRRDALLGAISQALAAPPGEKSRGAKRA